MLEGHDPPSGRIHCCWAEPLRAVDSLIGVCIARLLSRVGGQPLRRGAWQQAWPLPGWLDGSCWGIGWLFSSRGATSSSFAGVDFGCRLVWLHDGVAFSVPVASSLRFGFSTAVLGLRSWQQRWWDVLWLVIDGHQAQPLAAAVRAALGGPLSGGGRYRFGGWLSGGRRHCCAGR